MPEWQKHVVVASEVCEILLIKAEAPVNLIASNEKETQENLNTIQNYAGISGEKKIRLHKEELNKLRMVKD